MPLDLLSRGHKKGKYCITFYVLQFRNVLCKNQKNIRLLVFVAGQYKYLM